MKKVRFESPRKVLFNRMDESECHFPRPFIENSPPMSPEYYERMLLYSNDPVQRFECSDSAPYPLVNKSNIPDFNGHQPEWRPSNDLDLSMLDGSTHRPRPHSYKLAAFNSLKENVPNPNASPRLMTSIQNCSTTPPNVLTKDDNFFIRRGNIDKCHSDIKPSQNHLIKSGFGKENNPITQKAVLMNMSKKISPEKVICPQPSPARLNDLCRCHHCIKVMHKTTPCCVAHHAKQLNICHSNDKIESPDYSQCLYSQKPLCCTHCDRHISTHHACNCGVLMKSNVNTPTSPQNTVDKKTWAIKRYEEAQKSGSKDLEKQTNITKEKREPTVADLFKIIKLQNEQLQLLQEKVDKFLSAANETATNHVSAQNSLPEKLAFQRVDSEMSEQHKISIGVMTSFEMVRTSTVINHEYVKQADDNSHVQCNKSHISIKEVVSTKKPANLNFLEGITPVEKTVPNQIQDNVDKEECTHQNVTDDINDDKTFNEQSLYNLQVDNATTPLISPDQSMCLDVKDYSDSEESSDDHSNVGWTYYNKVMTHVNGMLHDSEMPSSASAMYKNTRQQCLQMQIDKTNLSVMKRVKFGDDPQGIYQPHIYAATTDTSIKMNQLAAKYLWPSQQQPTKPASKDIDMSLTTQKYMERHKLLTGTQTHSPQGELPRFLDITALKLQPKLL